jgi:hypothetical protein
MAGKLSRRALLAALTGAGCGRRLARRVYAMLFVASAGEKGLVVADLSDFRRAGLIPLGQTPRDVFRAGAKLFATCPDARTLLEIDARNFRVAGKTVFPGRIAAATVLPNASRIAILTEQPPALYLVDPASRKIVKRIPLPTLPVGIDVSNDLAAITTPTGLIRVSLASGSIAGFTELGLRPGVFRLHDDAKLILVGAADRPEIVTVAAVSGALLARLPLAFTPARFCFNADRGQMFVTGNSGDQIIIVSPYQNEVDQTIVGGRTPSGMAVGAIDGRNLLFVANPESGDVTLFDIDTRQHAASVHVGGKPGEILLTPGGDFALVVDRDNGDVAVIRVRTVLNREATRAAPVAKPIFTIFHTGPEPQSAAIL